METMIFEANMRMLEPVYGCAALTRRYQCTLFLVTKELQYVRMQIAVCKKRDQQQVQHERLPLVVCKSPNLHEDVACCGLSNTIDEYGFDVAQGKNDKWKLKHEKLEFEPGMDGVYGGCIINPDVK